MRILITGSSGQLGTEIARQLSQGYEITAVDVIPGEWTQHHINITNRDAVDAIMKGIDGVIHIASLHARHLSEHSKQSFIDTNITGTLTLLEAAARYRVKRFVYTSTTSLYGFAMVPRVRAVWVTETLPPQPRDIYDITKITAEELCQHFALSMGLPTICLRTARFFPEPPELMALYRLYRGVDVRDVAAAHILAVTNQDITFDVFNIAAQSPFQASDMPALLRDATPVLQSRVPEALQFFTHRGWSPPKSIDRVYVIDKAMQQLRYQPVYNFQTYISSLPD
ncbi:MAG: NAD-dependent epimerase/dehydratase family protein [Ktedonobacteraceae bacterium]